MAVYSIIKKSQLEGAKRLDAEYYQPEYLLLNEKLKKQSVKLLDELAFITDGIHASIDYDADSNIRCFSAQAPKNNYFESVEQFISEKQHTANKRTALKAGDILLSSVGTIGNAAVIDDSMLPANADRHVGLIRLHGNQVISPYFLSTFLNSKYGRFQSVRESTGNVQLNLFIDKIKTFIVPYPKVAQMQEVDKLAANAFQEREKSEKFYFQAENLLLEELVLKDFEGEQSLFSSVNFSELKETKRMDAEYFQPKYEKLESRIRKYESRHLEKVLENVSAKFNPLTQSDKLFKYVELSNINALIGIIDGFSEVLGKEAPSRAKRVLKEGDVIVSSVEGSLGKVALVHKEQKDFLASTGFFQFRSNEILPEVLLVLAKSIVFQWQLEKRCAGTILTSVPKESIKDMPIPILPKQTQQKIAELVRKSHESRKKAKELLEEAKRKVEQMIENAS
ncbi:MAG: Restriction endonuclease S subunit [Parcubacteria group bacterium GW2011_GWA2_47_16]|nr:MAG: Restriction endonuclease S subunit [Parcubacteria group bacterium GW2011_GWA2_47_16]